MRRKFLCGLAAWLGGVSLQAQSVPARDLWEFPLGIILQPAALTADPAGGLWNPAVNGLLKGQQIRVGVVSLSAPSDIGVEGLAVGAAYRRDDNRVFSVSIARNAIGGIVRTEFDPQVVGEIPYSSLMLTAGASAELLPNVRFGAALRWREGRMDTETRHALAADVGIQAEVPSFRKLRIGVSSFLWRPGREIDDRPSFLAAADAVLLSYTDLASLRAGYSLNAVNRGSREQGPYAQVQLDRLEASVSYVTMRTNNSFQNYRIRSGIAMRYAKYLVGVGREEGVSGLGPMYQFTLSSVLR